MADKTDIINELANLKENVKMKWIIGGEAAVPPAVLDKVFK